MVSKLIDKARGVLGQVTSSEKAAKAVSSAKSIATLVAGSTLAAARRAAARAKAIVGDDSSRAPGKAPEAIGAAHEAGSDGRLVTADGAPGLSPEAQATIDDARLRAHAFIRDASVELETAPVDTPDDAQQVNPDIDSDPLASAEDVDGAVGQARADRYQE